MPDRLHDQDRDTANRIRARRLRDALANLGMTSAHVTGRNAQITVTLDLVDCDRLAKHLDGDQ